MNLGKVEKTWFRIKQATGEYVTCLFKTLASLVYMDDGVTTVEEAITTTTSPLPLTSGTFRLDSSMTITGIKNLLMLSFKNTEEVGRHMEIIIPNHDDTRRVFIIGEITTDETYPTDTTLTMVLKFAWSNSGKTVTITCSEFKVTGHWHSGSTQLVDVFTI